MTRPAGRAKLRTMTKHQRRSKAISLDAVEREEAALGFRRIKAAAISMKPRKWDKAWNADQLERYFRRAARRGVDLALAPEGVLEGYVINDVLKDPDLAPNMLEIAEPLDGTMIRRFRALARELTICLAFGFAERRGGEVYNCAVFIDHRGRICGTHQKTQLAEGYHATWYFNRIGQELSAFDTPLGRVGFLICYERWNPAIARALVLDGAQLLLVPSFGSRAKMQNVHVLARARENGVPIVEANVGVNLIISKGEKAAYHWGADHVSIGQIEIPAAPSPEAARSAARTYLRLRTKRMTRNLGITLKGPGRRCLTPKPAVHP